MLLRCEGAPYLIGVTKGIMDGLMNVVADIASSAFMNIVLSASEGGHAT